MKSLLFTILTFNCVFAQNLIFNGGFEDVNVCSELRTSCSAEAWLRNPLKRSIAKSKGYEKVHRGKNSENIVVANTKKKLKNRTFIYSMLKCELIKDEKYLVSLWLNPLSNTNIELDVLLSNFELVPGEKNPLSYKPSLHFSSKNRLAKEGQWVHYQYEYTAKGGEQFITIGNFRKDPKNLDKKVKANNLFGDIIYFIDDISVRPVNDHKIENCDSTSIRKLLYDFNYRHTKCLGLVEKEKVIEPEIKIIEIPYIAFDFDSNEINLDYQSRIDSISTYIRSLNPQSINIVGHTDNIGKKEYNQKLSLDRAEAVKFALVNLNQNLERLIIVKGNGADTPKVENNSEENRKINRRVEVVVTSKIGG